MMRGGAGAGGAGNGDDVDLSGAFAGNRRRPAGWRRPPSPIYLPLLPPIPPHRAVLPGLGLPGAGHAVPARRPGPARGAGTSMCPCIACLLVAFPANRLTPPPCTPQQPIPVRRSTASWAWPTTGRGRRTRRRSRTWPCGTGACPRTSCPACSGPPSARGPRRTGPRRPLAAAAASTRMGRR